MSGNARIVCYGSDERLLETRRWVLEKAGYTVFLATQDTSFVDFLRSEALDLVLLCHTLSPGQVDGAIGMAKAEQPSTPILRLSSVVPVPEAAEVSLTVDAVSGPRAILDAVEEVLDRRSARR